MVEIIQAEIGHIPALAADFRPADRSEVWASSLTTPDEALRLSLSLSTLAWTVMDNGTPMAMFGVSAASSQSNHGIPWLLGTTRLEHMSRLFLTLGRSYVTEMTQHYAVLSNRVDARNTASIRWLRWLGFRIHPARPTGPFNLPFHPFELRRQAHV